MNAVYGRPRNNHEDKAKTGHDMHTLVNNPLEVSISCIEVLAATSKRGKGVNDLKRTGA